MVYPTNRLSRGTSYAGGLSTSASINPTAAINEATIIANGSDTESAAVASNPTAYTPGINPRTRSYRDIGSTDPGIL